MTHQWDLKLFKESRHVWLLGKSDKSITQPGGLQDRLFKGPSPLHTQADKAAEIPSDTISNVLKEAKDKVNTALRAPFNATQATGEFVANTTQKIAGDVPSRVLQTGTTIVTAAATVPAAVISKVSTKVQNLPSIIVKQLLRPFRWIVANIPFTNKKPEA